ncbi:hypothetical protein ABFT51_03680 [Paenibacillus peoriae]|uniref:hypothetical protein n=1 Tax=Paenibacillus peoriae TaxID=59893 RepID=UPI0032AFB0A3
MATEGLVKEDAKKQGYDSEFVDYYIIEMSKNPPEEAYTVLPAAVTISSNRATA